MADYYYALTLSAQGVSTSAYYSVTPTSDLEFTQGGVTIMPTQTAATLVNIYPETLQIQAPAGMINAGVTIQTGADQIAGRLMVSPPVNVAVTITLYGVGGQQLGQTTLDPGVGDKTFNFAVSEGNAISKSDVPGVLRGVVPPATPLP